MISGCSKDPVDLKQLLQSHQWQLTYYKIETDKITYYATEYKYRIQFRDANQIAIYAESGDVEYGNWSVYDEVIDITMNRDTSMSGKWELIKYYVWGYDQHRLQLRCTNKEIGLTPY
jgi:hypothetical protein